MAVILVTGGARSGKSSFGELIARKLGGDSVIYIASGVAVDKEMEERIAAHKKSRPDGWKTIEAPSGLPKKLKKIPEESVVLFDCLTTYLSNLLIREENKEYREIEKKLLNEVKDILNTAESRNLDFIIIQNEIGQGVVPPYKLGRYFRDISGRAARLCAAKSERVFSMTAGLPREIKGEGLETLKIFSEDGEVDVL
ncbi:MAG: bifunctional adenosylcobinamide kinase/adenosylcobinamide-phosphate guanylyltransferase [Bacillota bacterium]